MYMNEIKYFKINIFINLKLILLNYMYLWREGWMWMHIPKARCVQSEARPDQGAGKWSWSPGKAALHISKCWAMSPAFNSICWKHCLCLLWMVLTSWVIFHIGSLAGQAWRQGQGVAGHITMALRKQKQTSAGAPLTVFIKSWTPACLRWCCPHSGQVLLLQLTSVEMYPLEHPVLFLQDSKCHRVWTSRLTITTHLFRASVPYMHGFSSGVPVLSLNCICLMLTPHHFHTAALEWVWKSGSVQVSSLLIFNTVWLCRIDNFTIPHKL